MDERKADLQSDIQMPANFAGSKAPSPGYKGNQQQTYRPKSNFPSQPPNPPSGQYRGAPTNGGSSTRPICQICTKTRHVASCCFKRYDKNFLGAGNDGRNMEKQIAAFSVSTHHHGSTSSFPVDPSWYADTGATDHLTNELDKLQGNTAVLDLSYLMKIPRTYLRNTSITRRRPSICMGWCYTPMQPNLTRRPVMGSSRLPDLVFPAPRAWHSRLCSVLGGLGFKSSTADTSLFILRRPDITLYLLVYVDDIIVVSSSTAAIDRLIQQLRSSFALKDLGQFNYFLGIEVKFLNGGLLLTQRKYASKLLRRAGLLKCGPSPTPMISSEKLSAMDGTPLSADESTRYRSIVGGLQYLTMTRPDLSFSVNKDMFAAGTDTTYIALEWAMSELMKNPTTMRKLEHEVRSRSAGGIAKADMLGAATTPYLKAVVKETLRLHPPTPLLMPRECMQDATVMGYHVAKGTLVFVNAWAINRDPASWHVPDEFLPERFLESEVDFRGGHFQFIPFGAGRRICPGMQFGLATIELARAREPSAHIQLGAAGWHGARGARHVRHTRSDDAKAGGTPVNCQAVPVGETRVDRICRWVVQYKNIVEYS
ncbi:hypothetical protein QYE76_002067 [Lolium multiflorum]|uniref:Reverse transcriptase Ty1/copia-type domain-containing protein n=1 Tax=Lolium multiflorum TaxID=4521 RepID=A0AAD8VXX4_LOLMU|nr:hypothetical protein QYE76_002067 [Lolium multiflorum]